MILVVGTTTNSATPVTVSGITNAVAVNAGDDHAGALLSTGVVECWVRRARFTGHLGEQRDHAMAA